jgi:hypothetical protein
MLVCFVYCGTNHVMGYKILLNAAASMQLQLIDTILAIPELTSE